MYFHGKAIPPKPSVNDKETLVRIVNGNSPTSRVRKWDRPLQLFNLSSQVFLRLAQLSLKTAQKFIVFAFGKREVVIG
jgi:hypothetical protein